VRGINQILFVKQTIDFTVAEFLGLLFSNIPKNLTGFTAILMPFLSFFSI
jgi:hypothetical protein